MNVLYIPIIKTKYNRNMVLQLHDIENLDVKVLFFISFTKFILITSIVINGLVKKLALKIELL